MAGKSVKCPGFGMVLTADTEGELVKKTQDHGKQAHGMETPESEAREAAVRGLPRAKW